MALHQGYVLSRASMAVSREVSTPGKRPAYMERLTGRSLMPTRTPLKSRPDFLDQAFFHYQSSGKGLEVELGWGDRRCVL